jgi:hypothetical protein
MKIEFTLFKGFLAPGGDDNPKPPVKPPGGG